MQTLDSRLKSEFGDSLETRIPTQNERVGGVLPQIVAIPSDEESAAKLVAFCGRENLAFVARGGGTNSHIGAAPKRCDLLISTANLNVIHEHDEGNATVEVGAGISLAALDDKLRACRQFAPIEYSKSSTLGGAVATDFTGSVALKFGTPRDLVVGLHVTLSDGRLVKAGGKVVKNVSGYDLNKLFIGSFGTLGLITRVTIRLRPNDEASVICGAHFSHFADAKNAAWKIFDGAFEPTSLRITSTRNAHQLTVRFDGVRASIESQSARLQEIAAFTCEVLPENSRLFLPPETEISSNENVQNAILEIENSQTQNSITRNENTESENSRDSALQNSITTAEISYESAISTSTVNSQNLNAQNVNAEIENSQNSASQNENSPNSNSRDEISQNAATENSIESRGNSRTQNAPLLQMRARLPLRLAANWAKTAQDAGATRTIWDCGVGIVRAEFDFVPNFAALRGAAEAHDGHLRFERAPLELLTPQNVWGETGADFFLMQRLKTKFDAANVCAPGRFVGGL